MFDTALTLCLLILASLYSGVLLGKRFGRGDYSKQLDAEREKMRAEVETEHKQLAVELHSELSKVRDSIVQSAHAYQNVVNTIDEKLAPWEDIQKSLDTKSDGRLPLLIVEVATQSEIDERAARDAQNKMSTKKAFATGAAKDKDDANEETVEGPSLHEKAAQLVRGDRVAFQRRPDVGRQEASAQETAGLEAADSNTTGTVTNTPEKTKLDTSASETARADVVAPPLETAAVGSTSIDSSSNSDDSAAPDSGVTSAMPDTESGGAKVNGGNDLKPADVKRPDFSDLTTDGALQGASGASATDSSKGGKLMQDQPRVEAVAIDDDGIGAGQPLAEQQEAGEQETAVRSSEEVGAEASDPQRANLRHE